jgi:hypothetical protein
VDVDWELEDWLLQAGERAERKVIDGGSLSTAERLIREFWVFDIHTRNGGVSQYFANHGPVQWQALKAAWLPAAVPGLGPIIAEVDRVIAGAADAYLAALAASPGVEAFYESHQLGVRRELRRLQDAEPGAAADRAS